MPDYIYSNIEENRFWIQVMSEDAEILYTRLIPDRPEAQEAKGFISRFDSLYSRSDKKITAEPLLRLNKDVYTATQEFRTLVLMVLRKQVLEGLFINLKPIFINNMISLTEEFLYLLSSFINNKTPVYSPIEFDIFWLPIFYTEARLITDSLGDFPVDYRERSSNLTYRINLFYQTAVNLKSMYRRLGTHNFPIAIEYRDGVRATLLIFAELIVDLVNQVKQKRLPGTLMLVDLDCVYRKLCYYNRQLSSVDNKPMPACDPGSPRLSIV
jgi:hypothetical protein